MLRHSEQGGGAILAYGRKRDAGEAVLTTREGREATRRMAKKLSIGEEVDLPFKLLLHEPSVLGG